MAAPPNWMNATVDIWNGMWNAIKIIGDIHQLWLSKNWTSIFALTLLLPNSKNSTLIGEWHVKSLGYTLNRSWHVWNLKKNVGTGEMRSGWGWFGLTKWLCKQPQMMAKYLCSGNLMRNIMKIVLSLHLFLGLEGLKFGGQWDMGRRASWLLFQKILKKGRNWMLRLIWLR